MHRQMALWATVLLWLSVTFLAATASAKGILDILREKGILSEQEYKQAVDEAQEQEKKAIQKAAEEGKSKLPDWLNRTSPFAVQKVQKLNFRRVP
jgi:polyhydroxyalkanoate synthesis regulator phasin